MRKRATRLSRADDIACGGILATGRFDAIPVEKPLILISVSRKILLMCFLWL